MTMHKHLKQSLRKWDKTLWKRLETYKETHPETSRSDVFYEVAWNPCGFCIEFGQCLSCPLRKEDICASHFSTAMDLDSPIAKMHRNWNSHTRKGAKNRFEKNRLKLLDIMKSHADKFEEG